MTITTTATREELKDTVVNDTADPAFHTITRMNKSNIRAAEVAKATIISEANSIQQKDRNQNAPAIVVTSSTPTCRVAIENKMDFHYETLESIAMRYPLPFERLPGCSQGNDTVVIFVFPYRCRAQGLPLVKSNAGQITSITN
jgi:iron only hydrogenase large subunit-like protein